MYYSFFDFILLTIVLMSAIAIIAKTLGAVSGGTNTLLDSIWHYSSMASSILVVFSTGLGFIYESTKYKENLRDRSIVNGDVTQPDVVPTRMFSGPSQYPPKLFKAYGIVAFKTRATEADKDRYTVICNAYVESIEHTSIVKSPLSRQMVTVWPVNSTTTANILNRMSRSKVCGTAVSNYDLVTAQMAISIARKSGAELDGQGPFLLAWSPGEAHGTTDALVLVSDLSDVNNNSQAKAVLTQWIDDIQEKPELWENGWSIQKIKLAIRLWAEKWGPKMLRIFGEKGN